MILVIPDDKTMRLRVVNQRQRFVAAPVGGALVFVVGQGGAPAPVVPVNTVLPAITGTVRAGETLTCGTGTWTESPSSYAYQWYEDGSPIIGASTKLQLYFWIFCCVSNPKSSSSSIIINF